ncbi:hypothetical protein [Thioalkalivibrio sp. ALE28]|uniref:hypothetical protein n=1 Tax=Thioalkalivibrio sp. ALE28 TaxID=1158179 RepID=UPI0012DEF161|nr:hypothetical protein [Thioalkalivibrio sp. ALE28]
MLDNREAVDRATGQINGCIRNIAPWDEQFGQFTRDLFSVVGDLHDNVWAHGMSLGVSMAQRWKVPHKQDSYLEFALADGGIGFFQEMHRVGLAPANHEQAIDWCIQEGHSTKLVNESEDPLVQTLPEDVSGNPMQGLARHTNYGNHHQGLGLPKLVRLASDFCGELTLPRETRSCAWIAGAKRAILR